jgi:hypothetical protein
MEKRKVMVIMLAGLVLAGYAAAVTPLVYEDFESYSSDSDLWVNWGPADVGNPFLIPYLDTAVKYEGSKSMRLDAPLMDGNYPDYFNSTADWGVIIRDDTTSTDASAYNIMTAMVRADSGSSISSVDFVVRDSFGYNVGDSGSSSVPNDGQWHKITAVLNLPDGDKSEIAEILPFFNIEPNVPTGIPQLWIDKIQFEHMIAVDEILQADVNGPFGRPGETVNYSFVMTQQPPADVNFILSPPETLDFGAGLGEPVIITFTTSNWNVAQYKDIDISSSASGSQDVNTAATSIDPNYNAALPGRFTVALLGKYGAPYVISPNTPVWTDIPDNTGIDLSNGIVGEIWLDDADMFSDKDWVEWAPDQFPGAPAYAEIVFDFGSAKDVNAVDIWHSAIDYYPPGNFKLSYSTNGTTYTTPKSYEPYTLSMRRAKTRINVSPVQNARYVKLRVECVNNDPCNWFFLSEVEFNAPKVITYPNYTYDATNIPAGTASDYRDPYMTKLMNGSIDYTYGGSRTFQRLDWVRLENASNVAYNNVIIYADYGKIKEFSNLSLNYATNMSVSSGVYAPSQVNLSFSDDGITYGVPVSLTGWYQGTGTGTTVTGKTDAKTFAPKTGRFVKIEIVRNTGSSNCLRFGEIMLSNRPQMTYTYDTNSPVWGNSYDQPGDVAYPYADSTLRGPLANLNFGDLANSYIPTLMSPYNDSDWVEWAPDQDPAWPAYGIVTFDLKSIQMVKNVAIVYSAGYAGMPAPGQLDAAFSTDGTFPDFVNTGAVFNNNNGDMNTPQIYNTVFTLPQTQTRYVKLRIHCRDEDRGNWMFISEVKFNVFVSDLNDDGAVNYKDVETMADQWLQSSGSPTADIAGSDGMVNFLDFAKLAEEWLY